MANIFEKIRQDSARNQYKNDIEKATDRVEDASDRVMADSKKVLKDLDEIRKLDEQIQATKLEQAKAEAENIKSGESRTAGTAYRKLSQELQKLESAKNIALKSLEKDLPVFLKTAREFDHAAEHLSHVTARQVSLTIPGPDKIPIDLAANRAEQIIRTINACISPALVTSEIAAVTLTEANVNEMQGRLYRISDMATDDRQFSISDKEKEQLAARLNLDAKTLGAHEHELENAGYTVADNGAIVQRKHTVISDHGTDGKSISDFAKEVSQMLLYPEKLKAEIKDSEKYKLYNTEVECKKVIISAENSAKLNEAGEEQRAQIAAAEQREAILSVPPKKEEVALKDKHRSEELYREVSESHTDCIAVFTEPFKDDFQRACIQNALAKLYEQIRQDAPYADEKTVQMWKEEIEAAINSEEVAKAGFHSKAENLMDTLENGIRYSKILTDEEKDRLLPQESKDDYSRE